MTSHLREGRDEPTVTEREAIRRERMAADRAVILIMARLRSVAATWDGEEPPSRPPSVTPNYPVIARRFVESQDFRGVVDAVCLPLPKIERPIRLAFGDGTVAWWEAERAWVWSADAGRPEFLWRLPEDFMRKHIGSVEDYALFGRMLSGEMELVEADAAPSTVRGTANDT